MTRPGVTEEDVARVVGALEAAGERVTSITVRARLGTGSLTTIKRHLDALAARPEADEVEEVPALPEAFLKEWVRFAEEAWRLVASQARKDADAVRQEAARAVEAARKEAEDAAALAMTLEETLEEAHAAQTALAQELHEARARLIAADATLAEVRSSAADIRRERDAATEERDRARDDAAAVRTELAVAERLREESVRRVERADAEVERLRQELGQVREAAGHERERAIADRTALEHTVSRLSDEVTDMRGALDNRDETIDALRQELHDACVARNTAEAALRAHTCDDQEKT